MINQFKIWFNRNSFKVFTIIFAIIVFYLLLKGFNDYYKEENKNIVSKLFKDYNQTGDYTSIFEETESNENNSINENETNNTQVHIANETTSTNKEDIQETSINLPKLNKSSDEYKKVVEVVRKILTTVYEAGKNDSLELKQDVYNMFSDELINDFSNDEVKVKRENILDYILKVDDIRSYYIGNIYRFSQTKNVRRYEIILRYKPEGEKPVDKYLVINIDNNNHTFSYDGLWGKREYIDVDKSVTSIPNKGSNTF